LFPSHDPGSETLDADKGFGGGEIIDGLNWNVGAGEVWTFRYSLNHKETNTATSDFKINAPSGSTYRARAFGIRSDGAINTDVQSTLNSYGRDFFGLNNDPIGIMVIDGSLNISASSGGTVTISFRRSDASNTGTIGDGSSVTFSRDVT